MSNTTVATHPSPNTSPGTGAVSTTQNINTEPSSSPRKTSTATTATAVETASTRREKLTVHDMYWQKMFKSLQEFKKQYGDCHVPPHYADKALSNWVKDQRRQYKLISKRRNHKGVMTPERIDLLEREGFDWNPNMHTCYNARKWRKMFELLSQYKKEHGDCNVAISKNMYYQQLGCWVSYQRKQYRLKMSNQASTMTDEKEAMLNSLGFVWDQHPSSSSSSSSSTSHTISSNASVRTAVGVAKKPASVVVDPKQQLPVGANANANAARVAQDPTSIASAASPDSVKSCTTAAATKTSTTVSAATAVPRTKKETVWMCEKCNFAFFPTMEEAVAHENQCTGRKQQK